MRRAMQYNTMRRRDRRGAALAIALVCLGCTTVACGLLLKGAILERRLAESVRAERQADLLVESAAARARARLAAEAGYTGETWEIAASELDGRGAGRIAISIQETPAERIQCNVSVQFPLDRPQMVRREHTFSIQP